MTLTHSCCVTFVTGPCLCFFIRKLGQCHGLLAELPRGLNEIVLEAQRSWTEGGHCCHHLQSK